MKKNLLKILIIFIAVSSVVAAQSWQSEIVYFDENDKLIYVSDDEGNRIPDFSFAGYKNGNEEIPFIPVVKTISPVEGDNTLNISNALFEVGLKPKNANGFRGALYLEPGVYEVKGSIKIGFDGIVLRGAGYRENPDSNTIIWATGNLPSKRTVITAGGGGTSKWSDDVDGSRTDIITDSVMVGDFIFEVEDASQYSVGDNIIIFHPCTEKWLKAVDYGGTHSDEGGAEPGVDVPWEVGSQPLVFNRYITAISGNQITIDVPVYNHLIKDLSQSYIYKYSRNNLKINIGIENIRIDIETSGESFDENHAWNAIDLFQIEDAWVKDCTMLHFGLSGIRTNTASRVTVENCRAIDPVSEVVGGNRYNFQAYNASQQILFKNCYASNGRHHYMSNGTSWTSGIVFYNCESEGAFTSSEGHRRWSMGMLWDNHVELDGPRPGYNPRLLGLYNRGYYGTSHGWSNAHSVAWHCDVNEGDLVVQKPPTAQNYAIGCFGKNVTGTNSPSLFDEPEGYIEGANQAGINPKSLYIAQLNERKKVVSVREFNLIPDNFVVYQNYPNPFNPNTTIKYELPAASKVTCKIYNLLGEEITLLISKIQKSGVHSLVWNGKDIFGNEIGSGIYFYKIDTAFGTQIKKMVMLK